MVNRILRDDPGKATMHNRQAISFSLPWESLSDYDMGWEGIRVLAL